MTDKNPSYDTASEMNHLVCSVVKKGGGQDVTLFSIAALFPGAVSYTHLDVYKRQRRDIAASR